MQIIVQEISIDFDTRQKLIIDGNKAYYVGPLNECPEDAIVERDLVSAWEIIDYIKMGYEAGKRGEEISVSEAEWEE